MEAWYFSPFPKEYYPDGIIDKVFIYIYIYMKIDILL